MLMQCKREAFTVRAVVYSAPLTGDPAYAVRIGLPDGGGTRFVGCAIPLPSLGTNALRLVRADAPFDAIEGRDFASLRELGDAARAAWMAR